MALNASSAGGPSIKGTPSKDRDRHPFPQSSHPSPAPSFRQASNSFAPNQPSSSTSSVPISPQALTVEALLKQHSAASDPNAAALEQAVSDRNVLSAQNAQLWKLIEKQRAGYNQILKELERIRGERDTYKGRLAAMGAVSNGTSEKRRGPSIDRASRPSLDTTSSHSSTSRNIQGNNPSWRQNSDDSAAVPKSLRPGHQLHSSRSYEPLSARANESGLQSNANHIAADSTSPPPPSSAPAQPSSTRTTSRPSPSPLIVPNRVDSITASSLLVANSPESLTPQTGEGNTMPNNSVGNGIQPSASARPLIHPRKSSLVDSPNGVSSSESSTNASLPGSSTVPALSYQNFGGNQMSSSYTPSQQPQYYPGVSLQTAPLGSNSSIGADSYTRQRTRSSAAASPQLQQSTPALISVTSTTTLSPLPQQQEPNQPQLLSVVGDTRPHMLSRDSRISLPDEARQYIVNMADSPAPSPRTDNFSPQSKLADTVSLSTSNEMDGSGRESEFLDMDEDDSDEDGGDEKPGDITTAGYDPVFETHSSGTARQTHTQGYNSDDQIYQTYQMPQYEYQSSSSQSTTSRDDPELVGHRKDKSRVAAEEFPLPPTAPSNIFIQRQQSLLTQEAQLLEQSRQQNPPQQMHQALATTSPSKHGQASIDYRPPPSSSLTAHSTHESYSAMQEDSYPSQQQPATPYREDPRSQEFEQPTVAVPAAFRALPLLSSDLPHTTITVSHSFVRPNDRGKEVLSFIVFVKPGHGKEGWKVEKMYSDVLGLDQRVRSSVGKGVGKKIANLPEGKLWKDHAPAKVDQRKAVLENYLQTLIQLPVKNNDEVIAFFTSDIVREQKQPVMQAGHKEGYLTKRGKNFGGWKTRFFVLQGPVLEYYDCRGGAHLGSITVTGAQIARQHRTERPPTADDEKEYRHAFLIVEAKKAPGGNHPRHVLCAESDEDRDSWVEMLVRYYTGTYSEDLIFNPSSGLTSVQSNSIAAASQQSIVGGQPRSSTSSSDMSIPPTPRSKAATRGLAREEISKGTAMPLSQLPPDASNVKLFQSVPSSEDYMRSSSPSRSVDPSPIDRQGSSAAGYSDPQNRTVERGLGMPSSLPDSSPLSSVQGFQPEANHPGQRANSELGHYTDLPVGQTGYGQQRNQRQHSLEQHRTREIQDGRKSFHPSLNPVAASSSTAHLPSERVPSPEKLDSNAKVKMISGPMNGAPIPSGFKFGGKELSSAEAAAAANERREKAKSRSFWGFGKGDKSHPHVAYISRAVFGVPLEEALDVAQMCNLPAIVFRSIQYLEAKKADQEEGIYRLSGSSAVIKSLKDRFNNEGDVDLLASDEYWDPHAIAGLLKSFLRELPSSILTRDLHLKFLAVIDFVDAQERIKELSHLIAALPIANYSLLRALTAHLILIVQNSNVNKMTMRNVGIVFSPTLGIPAGVFSLMLGEFNRVFNVDADANDMRKQDGSELLENSSDPLRRNSRQYTDAAADQLLGLSGRSLTVAPAEETQSDGDDSSIQDESGTETTEGEVTVESSSSASPVSAFAQKEPPIRVTPPDTPNTPTAKSKAAHTAASRGLNVTVTHSDRGNRHSRMMGLPASPRPTTHSPSRLSNNSSPTPGHE